MAGLYECRERRYRVKVLRRVDTWRHGADSVADDDLEGCNPVPTVGPVETGGYEEAWHMVEKSVVVGCECTRPRRRGSYFESRGPRRSTGDV